MRIWFYDIYLCPKSVSRLAFEKFYVGRFDLFCCKELLHACEVGLRMDSAYIEASRPPFDQAKEAICVGSFCPWIGVDIGQICQRWMWSWWCDGGALYVCGGWLCTILCVVLDEMYARHARLCFLCTIGHLDDRNGSGLLEVLVRWDHKGLAYWCYCRKAYLNIACWYGWDRYLKVHDNVRM